MLYIFNKKLEINNMKGFTKEIRFGLLLSAILIGLLTWFIIKTPVAGPKIVIAAVLAVLLLGLYVRNVIKKGAAIENGEHPDDEFTKLAKIHAGSTSFQYSMVLWWFIFIFNDVFNDRETMLGVGILGAAAIYGLVYWYYRSTSSF
jgi:hypothetical protein